MEDTRTVIKLMTRNCFMATLDLEDAYLTVPVRQNSRKYLRFVFQGNLYQFRALPFGLCISPYIFTKIVKTIIAYLRSRGFLSVVYLDDWWIVGETSSLCQKNVDQTINLLKQLGFLINYRKSNLIPSVTCKFLGLIFDSGNLTMEITPNKRADILQMIDTLLAKQCTSIENFASFIGKLIAACPAIPYGWLYVKRFERAKIAALNRNNNIYESEMGVPLDLKEDWDWWKRSIATAKMPLEVPDFSAVIFTDASRIGWGASMGNDRKYGHWTEDQKKFHINYLELLAIKLGLAELVDHLSNCRILIRVDNTTAMAYINKMGCVQYPLLNSLAREIWQWAEERKIQLVASYIKSAENVVADYLSRITNPDTEWSLAERAFKKIVENYGKPEVDLFASYNNKNAICISHVFLRIKP